MRLAQKHLHVLGKETLWWLIIQALALWLDAGGKVAGGIAEVGVVT